MRARSSYRGASSCTPPSGTTDAAIDDMGMLVVLAVLAAIVGAMALFIHAVRTSRGGRHGWLVVLPLIVAFGWVIEQIVVH